MKEWKKKLVVVLLGASSCAAFGANRIVQWNPDISSSAYLIDQYNQIIHIYEGDPDQDFIFEAYDDVSFLPGDIDSIILEDSGASAVNIKIVGNTDDPLYPPRYHGARNVHYIWVKLGEAPRNLKELDITGDLGFDVWGANVKTVSGPISVGGNLNVQFDADVATAGASFQVNGNCGYITIGDAGGASVAVDGLLLGGIGGGGFGNITIGDPNAPSPQTHTGWVQSFQSYGSTLTINGHMAGSIELGNLNGATINVTGDLIDAGSNYFRVGRMVNFAHLVPRHGPAPC